MNRYKKVVLCIVLAIIHTISYAQDSIKSPQALFEKFSTTHFTEKLFIHTDKTVYEAGDIIWMRCYIVDGSNNSLSGLSKICYIEITGADKKTVLQAKVEVDSGMASASLVIPSSIRSGNYIIRGYTNWMKNFDASYFEQPLTIININKKPLLIKSDSNHIKHIQFFPEGGNLVYGLNSVVAFKITDEYGNGIKGKGNIYDDKNKIITSFETLHSGMGSFNFKPLAGNTYHAIIEEANNTAQNLPSIYNTGWTMHLKDEGEALSLSVSTNISKEQHVYFLATNLGSVKLVKLQPIENGETIFTIQKSKIPQGITQFTLFNDLRQPVCERLYYQPISNILNIEIKDRAVPFNLRNKSLVDINTSNNTGNTDASLSVSVYLIDSLQAENHVNLLNYLWLSSELKGTIENPDYYFNSSLQDNNKALDNLMLVNGWRRFKWEEVLENKIPSFTYMPEYEGHIISGKVNYKKEAKAGSGIIAYLSVPGRYFKLANSTSDSNGTIRFNVGKFYGEHQLIVQTNLADSNYRLSLDNPFSERPNEFIIQPLLLPPSFSNAILLRSINSQAQNIYQHEMRDRFIMPKEFDTTGFYGNPTKSYLLDNYTRFPTMEEVMREYVKEVHVRKAEKNFHFNLNNFPDKSYFSDDPLVLFDGVPVFDINKIIAVDPLKVKRIDLVTNRFFQGQQEYDGIINYLTYNDDLDGFQPEANSVVVEYEGLQLKREFYSPTYETNTQQISRIPDYRNMLYWSPNIKTKNGKGQFSFYTSDIPGHYIMVIEGFDSNGNAGVAIKRFTVSATIKQ